VKCIHINHNQTIPTILKELHIHPTYNHNKITNSNLRNIFTPITTKQSAQRGNHIQAAHQNINHCTLTITISYENIHQHNKAIKQYTWAITK